LVAAIVVAAGRGERLAASDGGGPKQYRRLGGPTVLARSVAAFLAHPRTDRVLVVIHADDTAPYAASIARHEKLLPPVPGGATRQASVLAGLEALGADPPEIVLIHDAARPFVSGVLIENVIAAVRPGLGAIPGVAIADTLKRVDAAGKVEVGIARDGLYGVQTPQGFMYAEILAAHRDAAGAALTDDAAVADRAGLPVVIVPSGVDNMKITTAADLAEARRRLSAPDIRTGNGYDVHRLVAGDHVTLCGVRIPFGQSLDGHSDADVGLHALTDALLATIGDGDIGSHFPPSDPRWKGADSAVFLAHAASLVRRAGGRINHADVTLICEAPKIGPHREAMRARIAETLAVEAGRVSVKATTNEGIGFVGRREGIAAIATATVAFSPASED